MDAARDLDDLLDPARLAAAWDAARPRTEPELGAIEAPAAPVDDAHAQLRAEIERTLAACPAIADRARVMLAAPLAQLAAALDPLDLAAAERALDQLEDLWQALLSDAGWPALPDRGDA